MHFHATQKKNNSMKKYSLNFNYWNLDGKIKRSVEHTIESNIRPKLRIRKNLNL